MRAESLVVRFFRWRWALSVLLVTGALAFSLAAMTLIPTNAPESLQVGAASEGRSSGSLESESAPRVPLRQQRPARSEVLERAHAPSDPAVEGLFRSTPTLELPPPLEEPEPPPEPLAAPVPTEISVPESALGAVPDRDAGF